MRRYNPERRAWRGKSYKKGGRRFRDLRDKARGVGDTDTSEHWFDSNAPAMGKARKASGSRFGGALRFTFRSLLVPERWVSSVGGVEG